MKGAWVVFACVLGLALVFSAGCATQPAPRVQGYSDALDLQRMDNHEDAIAMYEAYIETNPDSALVPFAWYRIAESRLAMRDLEGAVATYEAIIDNYPDCPPAQWAQEDLAILDENPELLMGPAPVEEVMAE